MTVLDVGAGRNPDPRADTTLDIQPPADHVADLEGDWPIETDSVDRIIARHVVEHLAEPAHFFGEAARVLGDGGRLEVTVPLGSDALTDHDHATVWRYATPEQFCQRRQRPWDPETPFVLVARDLRVWGSGPERLMWDTPLGDALARQWPAWAAHRCPHGELTAVFERGAR